MKRTTATCMLAAIVAVSWMFAERESGDEGLTFQLATYTGVEAAVRGGDWCVIDPYLVNRGSTTVTVLAGPKEAQDLWSQPIVAWYFFLQRDETDVPIQPSLVDMRPVVLQPGERTLLSRLVLKRDGYLTSPRELILVYEIEDEIAERFQTWRGEITLKITLPPVASGQSDKDDGKAAQPSATDNPADAQRLREDH